MQPLRELCPFTMRFLSLGQRTGFKCWSGLKTGRSPTGHGRNIITERASAVEVSKLQ